MLDETMNIKCRIIRLNFGPRDSCDSISCELQSYQKLRRLHNVDTRTETFQSLRYKYFRDKSRNNPIRHDKTSQQKSEQARLHVPRRNRKKRSLPLKHWNARIRVTRQPPGSRQFPNEARNVSGGTRSAIPRGTINWRAIKRRSWRAG